MSTPPRSRLVPLTLLEAWLDAGVRLVQLRRSICPQACFSSC
jgi:hypothetical protein